MNNLNPEIEAYIMEQCKVKGIVIGKTLRGKGFCCDLELIENDLVEWI